MVNSKGFSLIEFLMGIVISLAVFYAVGALLIEAQKNSTQTEKAVFRSQDAFLVENLLKRTISFSHYRLYGLNGSANADAAFSRILYPQNGLCADLSSARECRTSTSVVFATIDGKYDSTTKAYCWVTPGSELMVDDDIEGFLRGSSVLALTFPPVASVWFARGNPRAVDLGALPSDCYTFLDRGPGGYVTANRRVLSVSPFSFPGVSASPPVNVRIKMALNFPLDVNRVLVHSAGLMPSTPPQRPQFSIQRCDLQPTSLQCRENLLSSQGVERVTVFEIFKTRLGGSVQTQKYQITGDNVTLDASCVNPRCLPMRLASNSRIPYYATRETVENIVDTQFSGLKQDLLRRLDFQLTDPEGKKHIVSMLLD